MDFLETILCALGSRRRRGELCFEDGQGRRGFYFGDVSDGKANGYGKWVCSPHQLYEPEYEGEFENNQMHGSGTKRWKTGDYAGNTFSGGFRRGKKHGPGEYCWANGDRFRGTWRDGPRHGDGVFYRARDGKEERHTYDKGTLVAVDGQALRKKRDIRVSVISGPDPTPDKKRDVRVSGPDPTPKKSLVVV